MNIQDHLAAAKVADARHNQQFSSAHFRAWHDDADIPRYFNGRWIDDETGLPYVPPTNEKPASRAKSKAPDSVIAARHVAAGFGGKSLSTGTTRQKYWAEEIRAKLLSGMGDTNARKFANPDIATLNSAKFWIENRHISPTNFAGMHCYVR